MQDEAVGLIKGEHRCLAAVLDALSRVVSKAAETGRDPEFRLLHAMLYYLREFPERRHHPSEDASLFALLMQRTSTADEYIRELQDEHDRGEAMLGTLTVALSTWEAGHKDGLTGFAGALKRFSEFYWRHMDIEENRVLPIAQKELSEQDWRQVRDTFAAHADPLLGKRLGDEFDALFADIVRMAPAPIGLG